MFQHFSMETEQRIYVDFFAFIAYCMPSIPLLTSPHHMQQAAMHQFPEMLNCFAIVQKLITPPPTTHCVPYHDDRMSTAHAQVST